MAACLASYRGDAEPLSDSLHRLRVSKLNDYLLPLFSVTEKISTMAPTTTVTRNLRLRPLHANDTEAIIRLRTDPQIFYWRTSDTPAEATQWLKDRLEDPKSMIYCVEIMVPVASDVFEAYTIGLTGAHQIPEIGYIFSPSHWGKGYATEALRAWMSLYWQMHPQGHPSLEGTDERFVLRAETGPEGKASAKVLQNCGFAFERKKEIEEEYEKGKKGAVVVDCWVAERPGAGRG